jgi:DNA repair protein RadC
MKKLSEIQIVYRTSKNAQMLPVLRNAEDAYKVVLPYFNSDTIAIQEQFIACYLNSANQVKGVYAGFSGGISGTMADIRIILAIALKTGSTGIIVAHNHPSGNLKASKDDIRLTDNLKSACLTMEISLIDHLIISPYSTYMSFIDSGLLNKIL